MRQSAPERVVVCPHCGTQRTTRANGGSVQLHCQTCGQRFPCPPRRTSPTGPAHAAVPPEPWLVAVEPVTASAPEQPATDVDRESDGPIMMLLFGGLALTAALLWTRGRG
jgi:hypothetical protein